MGDWTVKNAQGKEDVKELFRDAALYEYNYTKHNHFELRHHIDCMSNVIETSQE